ncbi:MAG: hypothetical protein R3E53_12125 [Myxococcota bacterium]
MLRTVALALLLGAASAGAVDGVIELNVAAIQAGGITPGDAPGFPATLSREGRYRLTGSLVLTSRATSILEVTADRVDVDLNGFTLGYCTVTFFCFSGSANGIDAGTADFLRVGNGVVRGAGGDCIDAGNHAVVEDLIVEGCNSGIRVGENARIQRVSVANSTSNGIVIYPGGLLSDSSVTGSGFSGVHYRQSVLIVDSIIRGNESAITTSAFSLYDRAGYRNTVITGNNGSQEDRGINGNLVDLGGNLCGSDAICP